MTHFLKGCTVIHLNQGFRLIYHNAHFLPEFFPFGYSLGLLAVAISLKPFADKVTTRELYIIEK